MGFGGGTWADASSVPADKPKAPPKLDDDDFPTLGAAPKKTTKAEEREGKDGTFMSYTSDFNLAKLNPDYLI